MKAENIKTVAVIGAGAMGQQIAMNTALNGREKGYKVILCDSFPAAIEKATKWAADYLAGRVAKGRLTQEEADKVAASLVINGDVDEAAKEADLVIEAIIEDLKTKRELFARISKICKPDAILSTNSSNIVSSKLADVTEHSERLLNIHYFNPALVMKLVEIVKGPHTSDETAETARQFAIDTGKTPLLQDLYEELLKQPEPEARRVATALELYCTGSLNLFNHPTNVKTDSRVVCIVLKNMGENLRKIAMHITNEFVSQAVDTNFREGVATWCYFDEFHVLLRDPLTASYFVAVWKMLRKKGCVPSALTQNVKDLLASREIENILDNTDFMILLSQAQSDRAILARQLGISEHQLSYITHSNSGEGLLFYGNVTIPFVDRFPKGEIYHLLTTRPEDMKNEAKTE